MTITLSRGTLIVMEGLDKAGKSTQIDRLRAVLDPSGTTFAHMPSGFTRFSAGVYSLLEDRGQRPASGLAQQLAHLACHADSMPRLVDSTRDGALVLDRWWWSTLSYGWYSGALDDTAFTYPQFEALVKNVWAPIIPSLVFVFRTPHELDSNNNDRIAYGYTRLLEQHSDVATAIPDLNPDQTTELILSELAARGLVERDLR